jgi:hypothetical protein
LVVAAPAEAQLNKLEANCVKTLQKDGYKLSKTEGKVQQKCVKDAANGKLTGTTDDCIDDDLKGKVAKSETKTLEDEGKKCTEGSGFVGSTGVQTNLSAKAQALELLHDLLGASVDGAVSQEKVEAKCQQKIQKFLDKLLSTELKVYNKCAKLAAKSETTVDKVPFENCLAAVTADAKVIKIAGKVVDQRVKQCGTVTLNTVFPGDCALVDPLQFDACAEAATNCRACTTVAGIDGLSNDCDLYDNGLDDGSCADAAPTCGDSNVDPGEECDPGAEPICCNSDCTNVADATSCDDGAYCTGIDQCSSGVCVSAGDPCTGGGECNEECDEVNDDCFNTSATTCTDDGNVCTDDVCDGAGGCSHPNNTDPCDDLDACTTVDVCGGGTCNGSVPPDCSDGNVCTDDVCVPATGCTNPNNSASCDDGTFCNGTDTCGGGSCSIHAGDPCSGGDSCNSQCNEGPDTCFQTSGTTCGFDAGGAGPEDACDQNADECDGAGTCVNLDPAEGPELCYSAGDEDCDGFADSADPDPTSICASNGTETCTCADACTVGQIVPAIGVSTPLAGLVAWSVNASGSVTTTVANPTTGYATSTRQTNTYAFAGKPANLDVWWGVSDNAPHNADLGLAAATQFRFTASEADAQSGPGGDQINEGPHTSQTTGATTAEFNRADGLPIAFNNGCSASTATSLEMRDSGGGGGWTTFGSGSSFPTSALTPGSLATSAAANLVNTRLLPVASSPLVVDFQLQLGGAAMDPLYDACNTVAPPWGYGVNFTAALYGSYRNANVCP